MKREAPTERDRLWYAAILPEGAEVLERVSRRFNATRNDGPLDRSVFERFPVGRRVRVKWGAFYREGVIAGYTPKRVVVRCTDAIADEEEFIRPAAVNLELIEGPP